MGRDWIIDVLADLRMFARKNDMPLLTAQLEEASLVAEVEIANCTEPTHMTPQSDGDAARMSAAHLGLSRRT